MFMLHFNKKQVRGAKVIRVRLIVFTALLALQTASEYIPGNMLGVVVGLAAAAAWLVAFSGADKASITVSLILVAVGTLIFTSLGVDFIEALTTFGENAGVLVIMVLVPLIGIVIELGGYTDALGAVSADVKHSVYLYGVALFLSYGLGSVLLSAAIALTWTVLAPILVRRGKDPSEFLVTSLPRGYNASLMWTPSSPAMATALLVTGATWKSVAIPGVALSFVFLAAALILELGQPLLSSSVIPGEPREDFGSLKCDSQLGSREDGEGLITSNPKRAAWRKTAALTLGMGLFIVAVVAFESMGYSVFQAIVPCIAAALGVWGLLIGKARETWEGAADYIVTKVPAFSNQFLLMTTAGFVGTALRLALKNGIPGIPTAFHPHTSIVILLTSFLVLAISVAGIHPIIGMTIVHSAVIPFAGAVTPVILCLALLLGASLGFGVSPVSATILVTSACAGQNSIEAGIKKHWRYALVVWLISSALLAAFD